MHEKGDSVTHAPRLRKGHRARSRTLAARAVGLALLAMAATVAASEQSELLYSRGLVALQEDDYAEALALFERAVQADPDDASALFYRGLTRGRMKDYEGAIADLRAAFARDPELKEAALEIGVAYVQSGRYRAAIPWLEIAQKAEELDGQASLFLGIAQLRLDESAAARENFLRAAERDGKVRMPAKYYLGIIAYEDRRFDDAAALFTEVRAAQPETEMGRESSAFLDAIARLQRRYRVYGRLGIEYDSNVALAPDSQTVDVALGISDEPDGRVTLAAGGLYRLVEEDDTRVAVGYDFFQGLQFELTDFNLMDNRVHVDALQRWGIVELGAIAGYDYYMRDGDSFLSQVNGSFFLNVQETEHASTTLLYRVRYNDYKEQPFGELLSGVYNTGGFRQFFYLGAPTRYVLFGYQYEDQGISDSAGAAYAYGGNVIEAGFAWTFPWAVDMQALYAYHRDDYAAASDGRVDDEHRGLLLISKSLLEYLTVGATFFADVNDSTQKQFTYERFVGGLFAEVTY